MHLLIATAAQNENKKFKKLYFDFSYNATEIGWMHQLFWFKRINENE